jgi:hypothetical protein
MPKGKITFSKLKDLIYKHLEETVGDLDDYEVTFAKLEDGHWRANVEFVVEGGREDAPETALFSVDSETGDVTEFQRGYTWRD